MRPKPVRRYRAPHWPNMTEFMANHAEMFATVPKRWQNKKPVMLMLACFLMIAASCHKAAGSVSGSRVAPIFEHGLGVGSFGGRANTANMLPEDEATKIIAAEAAKAGIAFQEDRLTLKAIDQPVTNMEPYENREAIIGTRSAPLLLDGTEDRRGISYEYLSVDDYAAMAAETNSCTEASYDTLRAARVLRDGLAKAKPHGSYGVFYDPLSYSTHDAQESLRGQVRDFIAWLKAQGVI